MKTTETTPNRPPQPRTFVITLSDAETASLVQLLKTQFAAALPTDVIAGDVFSFANIRFVNRPGQAQTGSAQIQLVPPSAAPAAARPAAPAATATATPPRTVPATPAAASPAAPAAPAAKA